MQINIKGKVLFRVMLGFLSGFLMLPLIYSLFIPPQREASATPPSSPDTVLSLSASSIEFLITPTSAGAINTGSLVASVTSSDVGGYTLRMKASEFNPGGTGDTGNYLIHTRNDSFSIPTLANESTKTSFPVNYWGYSTDDTNYKPVPISDTSSSGDVIATTNVANTTADEHTVYLSAKANASLASGAYTNILEFSAVGNSTTISFDQAFAFYDKTKAEALDGNYYYKMQDMVKDICVMVANEQQTTLVDTRDQRTYTIFKSKAPNSRCWMSQNLDLNLATATILTDANTDLNSVTSWTPARDTIATGNLSYSTWSNSNDSPHSYDPGDVYVYTSGDTSNDEQYASLAACKLDHTEDECKRYHVGNYYNWTASVASNDTSGNEAEYEQMPDSICPKGWKLPQGPTGAGDYSDYNDLLVAQGIIADGTTTYLTDGFNNFRSDPLFFVRAGYIYGGSNSGEGVYGDWWTASVYSGYYAYRMRSQNDDVDPQRRNQARSVGYSVRCVSDNQYRYFLNYESNGANVSNLPANQIERHEDATYNLTINAVPPTRTGYNFLGYATSADGDVEYQPGGSISVTSASPTATLYAKWGTDLGFNNSGITTMQAMTSTICANANQGTPGLLQDARDGKVYSIVKASDNKCWMSQNLDLDLSGSTTLTNITTDLNSVTSWMPARDTVATGGLSASTWSSENNNPYSYNPGENYWYTSGSTSDDTKYTSLSACVAASHTVAECRPYHIGNYYNWSAAVASNDTSARIVESEQVPNSICPKGWRLPYSPTSTNSDYRALLVAQGIIDNTTGDYEAGGFDNARISPLFLVRPGYIDSGGTFEYGLGSDNGYWSAGVASATTARMLHFDTTSVYPQYGGTRSRGYSVRCVANEGDYVYSLSYEPNGTDVTGLPVNQVVRNNNTSHTFTIGSATPVRTNYSFLGYATSADGTVAYQPGNTVSLTSSSPAITLYAKWKADLGFNDSGITTMQDMTSTICANAPQGTIGLLKDERDNKAYSIFKGNDNRCWMNQNLDFNLSSSTTLYDTDTDLNSVSSWTPESPNGNTITPGNFSNDWVNDNNNPYSYDPGDIYVYTSGSTSNDIKYDSLAECMAAPHTAAECRPYHIGNYYNWSAAVASNDTSTYTSRYTQMPNSICPSGWRLPQGPISSNDYSDFDDLLAAHSIKTAGSSTSYLTGGFNNIRTSPLFFVRAGDPDSSNFYSGIYRSSTVYSSSVAYTLYIYPLRIYPQYYADGRSGGASVRCVAR